MTPSREKRCHGRYNGVDAAWAAAKRSARGRSEFRINPNMKSRGELLGSRAAAQMAAFRKTAPLGKPALQRYWGKLTVRCARKNPGEGDENMI